MKNQMIDFHKDKNMLKNDELEYGTVLITKGKYKNQIGYYLHSRN